MILSNSCPYSHDIIEQLNQSMCQAVAIGLAVAALLSIAGATTALPTTIPTPVSRSAKLSLGSSLTGRTWNAAQ